MNDMSVKPNICNKDLNDFHNAKITSIKMFKNVYNLISSFINLNSKFQQYSQLSSNNLSFLVNSVEKSSRIINILERNQMKCAFFGRTSNGKSSVINAILGQKILPFGIGHTTNCFLQIQGISDGEGFIRKSNLKENIQNNLKMDILSEKLPIPSILELGHALSLERSTSEMLINLFWPNQNCEILKNDVALLDSPGIDIDPDIDFWINYNCLDADVFVLVVNSESTITQTEKDFFHKVNEKVSKPNVFILNNRWDVCDKEENKLETKQQHFKRCMDFLSKELNTCLTNVAEERIYFISAKEMLELRTNQSFNKEKSPFLQERSHDFLKFEKTLETVLCQSALKTKFRAHIIQGLEVLNTLSPIILGIKDTFSNDLKVAMDSKLLKINIVRNVKFNITEINQSVNKYINEILENIRVKVEDNLKFEIKHLNVIVKDFKAPFHAEANHLLIYKTDLNNYVENVMNTRLSSLCSILVKSEVMKCHQFLFQQYNRLEDIKMDDTLTSIIELSTRHDITIPCNSLFSEFKEDLSFQSPLSPYSLFVNMIKLSGIARNYVILNYSHQGIQPFGRLQELQSMLTLIYENLIDKTFMGFCIVTFLFYKSFKTGIITSSFCSYSLIYLFEKIRWNMTSQEDIFKKQFVKYALKQLSSIIDISARSYSSVIKQELLMNHKSLARFVDNEVIRIENELNTLDGDIIEFNDNIRSVELLRSEAESIKIEFRSFQSKYFLK